MNSLAHGDDPSTATSSRATFSSTPPSGHMTGDTAANELSLASRSTPRWHIERVRRKRQHDEPAAQSARIAAVLSTQRCLFFVNIADFWLGSGRIKYFVI
jgi:hypothetical protein